ncbi:MAG: hypothetical protein LBS93_02765 [Synergistaceae bacterium]|jgi:hypothetical protein|nr:hypothetical protein [Synergistaceae bacterium]
MSDFSQRLNYYQPSGAAPIIGVFATLAAGVAGGSLLGAIYAFINHHDPLVYINLLLLFGFGIGLGLIVSKCVRAFRIRSEFAAASIALVVFAAAYAVHWFFYISTVLVDWETNSPFDVVTIAKVAVTFMSDPGTAWEVITDMNAEGMWSVGSSGGSGLRIRGLPLTALWVAEALVIAYHVISAPVAEAGRPYSERQDRWMNAHALPKPVAFIADEEAFKNALARGDYSAISTPLEPNDESSGDFAAVTIYEDSFEPCVSVSNVRAKVKKEKNVAKEVIRYLKISPDAAQNIVKSLS